MQREWKVGDRVLLRGYAFLGETDRYGCITKLYFGVPSAVSPGTPMADIFVEATGEVKEGYLQDGLELAEDV
jgi:hypothetical protein